MAAEKKYADVGMKIEGAEKLLRLSEQAEIVPLGETVKDTNWTSTQKEENTMLVRFIKEKDTKNTVKFAEEAQDGQNVAVGTLYVQKAALKAIGWTDGILTVEIKAAD